MKQILNAETLRRLNIVKNIYGNHDGNIAVEEAYYNCSPDRPGLWAAKAVKLDGDKFYIGTMYWDFSDCNYPGDMTADCYDWENNFDSTDYDGPYDLTDKDELNDLIEIIDDAYHMARGPLKRL